MNNHTLSTFPRQFRLQNAADYATVFRTGTRGRSRYFSWRAIANQRPYSRLGLAVSKRRLRRAVDRNRVRRLIKESFRHHQHLLTGVDIVVFLIAQPPSLHDHTVARDLAALWPRIPGKLKTLSQPG